MKIEFEHDRYNVYWTTSPDGALEAQAWCENVFGSGWGIYNSCLIYRNNMANVVFSFHKLYHAQWFCLKYMAM